MLGLVVEEYAPYMEAQSNTFCTTENKLFECSLWSDVIHLKTAQALATFEQDYYAGNPAVTHNQFGKGNAFYVATVPNRDGMEWLLEQACKTADVQPVSTNIPAGVELLQRTDGKSTFMFVLNHSGERVNVPIDGHGHDLLTGAEIKGSVELEPPGVAIIQI
jgi:beta-galactosidase